MLFSKNTTASGSLIHQGKDQWQWTLMQEIKMIRSINEQSNSFFIKWRAFEKSPTGEITIEQLLSLVNYWPRTTNILKIRHLPLLKLHSISPAKGSAHSRSSLCLFKRRVNCCSYKKMESWWDCLKNDTITKWKSAVTLVHSNKGLVATARLTDRWLHWTLQKSSAVKYTEECDL